MALNITNENYEALLADSKPLVIDFWAEWCGPCRAVAPIVEELAEEYQGKVDIYKVNIDDEEELATVFGIRSVPTMLFIPLNGNPQRTMGAMPKEQLKKMLDSIIK